MNNQQSTRPDSISDITSGPAPAAVRKAALTLNENGPKFLRAWHVDSGVTKTCVMIAPIIVTKVDRTRNIVKWRVPNRPFDVTRSARFDDVHSNLDRALQHAAQLLTELAKEAPDELQQ